MTQTIPMTQAGYEKMIEELKRLKSKERSQVIREIAEAREHGDLSENAEYAAAKEKQGHIEGRIQELDDKIARAQVIDISRLDQDKVVFGAKVTIEDIDTGEQKRYQLVGPYEGDIKAGRLSVESPLARALLGKEEGDEVELRTPGGVRQYEIVTLSFG